jgi:hypothetical protein
VTAVSFTTMVDYNEHQFHSVAHFVATSMSLEFGCPGYRHNIIKLLGDKRFDLEKTTDLCMTLVKGITGKMESVSSFTCICTDLSSLEHEAEQLI